MRRTTLPRWRQCELDFIENNIHQYPLVQFVEQMQLMQKQLGIHIRSAAGIKLKVYKLGYDRSLQEDRLSKVQLAAMLDISVHRVTKWIDCGMKYTQAHKNREVSILVDDFSRFAKSNLDRLYGIERYRLEYFLPSKLCEHVPTRPPKYRPVKCLENGRTFPHMAAAAAALEVNKTTVWRAVKEGRSVRGYSFQEI